MKSKIIFLSVVHQLFGNFLVPDLKTKSYQNYHTILVRKEIYESYLGIFSKIDEYEFSETLP
jgi:hypothetical protein